MIRIVMIFNNAITGEKQRTTCRLALDRIMKYSYNTSGTGILFGASFFIIGVNSFNISSGINYFLINMYELFYGNK